MASSIFSRIAAAALLWLCCAPAFADPALDGHASGMAFHGASPTATLTTSGAGVVVVLAGHETNTLNTPVPAMTVSGAGLTWIKRAEWPKEGNVDYDGFGVLGNGTYMSEWYAVSGGAISAQTITAAVVGGVTDVAGIMVFGVSGANTSTVFDPAQACELIEGSAHQLSPMEMPHVYTNNTNPLEFTWSVNTWGSNLVPPTGWTTIDHVDATCLGCGAYYYALAAFKVYGLALSNETIAWVSGWTPRGSMTVTDAICGATGPCTGPVRSPCPNGPAPAVSGSVLFQTPF